MRFKAVQSAEWEEKHESDGYVPLSEELELSSSSSTTVMYAPIVRPSNLEAILGPPHFSLDTSDSFAFSDRDSDQCLGRIYGLLVMGQGEGGILTLSWGCVSVESSILFSYCHCQEEISSDRDQLPQPIIKLS